MDKEELENKYSAFITEISEILGLGKPIDIIKLCATTDLFFQPLEKRIEELEKEVLEKGQQLDLTEREWGKDVSEIIHYKTLCTKLEKENEKLRGFEHIVQKMKDNGFDTFMSVKEFLQEHRELKEENAELEAQIEKMKNCNNCANYMISGDCPRLFRTGWCKNWEMTRSKK